MGNTASFEPRNRTGRKVVTQKLENAKKTGVLSLREHKLDVVPEQVFQIANLRTLDLSKNNLKELGGKLKLLTNLQSLNVDDNKLPAGSLVPVSGLSKLHTLSVGGNLLGKPVGSPNEVVILGKPVATPNELISPSSPRPQPEPLPQLPPSLKTLKLDANFLSSVPRSVVSAKLVKLGKLDLSQNQLAAIPVEIANLVSLSELNLDNNSIVSIPEQIGALKKLKVLSLKNNQIRVHSTTFSAKNPQPLPKSLFVDTPLIDLNLHGNKMTSTQLNEFEGYPEFLERREKVKTKNIYGGALTDLDVCGLE